MLIWWRQKRTGTAHAFESGQETSACLGMRLVDKGKRSYLKSKRCKMCIVALERQKKN